MISLIINLSALVANIKWILKVLLGADPQETAKLRQAIKEAKEIAILEKNPSRFSDIINNRR